MKALTKRTDLNRVIELLTAACAASRAHSILYNAMLGAYGSRGPDVSGAGREHWPEHIKDLMRAASKLPTSLSHAAFANRPPRVRVSTIRALYKEIQTRDGMGFYG